MDKLIELYANHVFLNYRTIDSVPEVIRSQVAEKVKQLEELKKGGEK